jgi:hypothetical protein
MPLRPISGLVAGPSITNHAAAPSPITSPAKTSASINRAAAGGSRPGRAKPVAAANSAITAGPIATNSIIGCTSLVTTLAWRMVYRGDIDAKNSLFRTIRSV